MCPGQTSRSAKQVQVQVSICAAGNRRGIQRTGYPSCRLRHQLRHPHSLQGITVLNFTLLLHQMLMFHWFDLNASALVGLHPQSWTNSQSRTVWEVHHFCHSVRAAFLFLLIEKFLIGSYFSYFDLCVYLLPFSNVLSLFMLQTPVAD